MAALLLTAADVAQALRLSKNVTTGSEFRPPYPITTAPWHNYDPNGVTMADW